MPASGSTRSTRSARPEGGAPGLGRSGWRPPGSVQRRPHLPHPGRPGGHGPGTGHGRAHEHGHGHGHSPGGPTGELLFFAWTVDGTEPTSQEDVFGVDPATGAVRRLTDQSSGVPFVSDRDPAWSPDRTRIVLMSADAVAPTHLPVLASSGAPVADLAVEGTTPAWLDAGTVVCAVGRVGPAGTFDRTDLVAVRVPDGLVTPLSALAPGEHLGEPAWHPTAGLAAVLTREDPSTGEQLDQRLVLAPPAAVAAVRGGGAPLAASGFSALAPGLEWPAGPAWSPDGGRLAFSAVRPCATVAPGGAPVLQMDVVLLDLAGGTLEWVTDDTTGSYDDGLNDGSPAFSPDGRWLAWARGHEDDWTHLVLTRLGSGGAPVVLLGGEHWFRWGLSW